MHNKKRLKDLRKSLRTKGTSAEAALWNSLKNKQLNGRKFRRQHSIENFIVDFYCPSEKVIIELDGANHLDFAKQQSDYERDEILQNLGFKVIRFENKFIFEDLEIVLNTIRDNFD
ncbi:endonuclease domain-containing protein [Flavobacteriaceae bacterium M23B6Z8]